MKKILLLSGSLASGGAERQIVTIARLLKEQGYDITFLCYAKEDFYAHLLEKNNIPIVWMIENNYLKRIIKVRNHIRKGNYDVVISFLHTPNFLNNFSAIGGKSWKVITGERSAKESTFNSRKGKVFAWFQKYSDVIVCNSNNAREMWIKNYPQYKNKLTTIYNTVTLPEITTEYIPRKDGKTHIIVAASYQYLKNPIGLINSLLLLDEKDRNKIVIDWYGRIEYSKGNTQVYDEAIDLIKNNNLSNVIFLHDQTKNIANIMNSADIVALFSKVEGLPNTICEGMMLGKPIIMTKVSDYINLVDDSNGFLCDWDDIKSIKNVLSTIISITNIQTLEMGKQSKLKAKEMFSKEIVLNKWINLIER
ncbi:MAG: glycosyltransferase [Bacteroidales bacterium]|nr:glycosyltransferase [Bacteroidales bacterium]